jgi:pyruvate kinase
MRLTKTICTLGPATANPKSVQALAERGMSIARFNFSHGSHDTHRPNIQMVRDVSEKHDLGIALMLDTKGAEIRTGDRETPLSVKKGELITFSHKLTKDKYPVLTINYPHFAKDVKDASCIIVDNGDLIFEVVEVAKDRVVGRAQGDASIGSRRHVNLPGADVSLPSLADKDWDDIKLACEEKMDFIALSFVRNAKEIEEVRTFCKKHKWPNISLIAKIENAVAVRNIDEIIGASDGVMIARGDLGAEVPLEHLPAIQDDILDRCRMAGVPVIVATHMLESMIKNPMPTRAEVTEIAHAALTGADSTMLSGETAAGKYPLEA